MSLTVPASAPTPNTYTPVSTFGLLLIEAMGPWMTLHLAWLCDAIGVMVDPYYLLVTDVGADGDPDYLPGYGELFNIDPQPGEPGYGAPTCPPEDLVYGAQFVGVPIPAGTDPVTAQSLVLSEAGLHRGTPGAVIAAAKRNLSGTQSVTYIERTYTNGLPAAGWFLIVVRPEEVVSVAALTAAVNAVKFDGLQWSLVQSVSFIWHNAIHTWAADTMTWAETANEQP
jgi:hypothetical protein